LSVRVLRLCLLLAFACRAGAEIPLAERRSGYQDMGRETRAMQDDDAINPATLWVLDGEALWARKSGAAARACADCHQDARVSMKGVAARYPAFDAAAGKVVNLEQRINLCRVERQQEKPLAYESRELLALTAYVARQSRGLPIEIESSERTKSFLEAGRATFLRRQGQLDLACTQCHDANWGKTLFSERISQGHPNAYPAYRLEWQTLGSLERRIRACLSGVRAEMLPYGAPEYRDLELFLMWRAAGLAIETPGVRR